MTNSAIGDSVNRVEGAAKVTGSAQYTADVALPGQVHAVLVQSEIPHGRVTEDSMRSSAERAGAAPGVLYVLTPLNCPPLAPGARGTELGPAAGTAPAAVGLTVQHVGQHMALVVADTLENATAAAMLFDLEYDERPALTDAHEVLAAVTAPDEHRRAVRHGSYRPDHFVKLSEEKLQDRRGEPPAARRAPGGRPLHHTAERALPDRVVGDGRLLVRRQLTVHDSTRWITGERAALAAYLGIGEDRVRVLAPLVGGAFGSKSFLWMHVVLCAVAAREVGRPVKLVLTRDQMFSSTGHRPRTVQDLVLVADDDGHVLSTEHHTLTETSTVAHFCEPAGLSTRFLYRSPHLEVSHRTARLNAPTPCFMRGPGEAPGLFALETAIDELAHEAGLDPLELRMRNHADDDQASGKPWSGKHLLECYRSGAKRFGWDDRPLNRVRCGATASRWGGGGDGDISRSTHARELPGADRCRRDRPIRLGDTRSRQRRADRHDSGGCRRHRAAAVAGRLRLRRLRFSRRPVQRRLADHRDGRLGGPRGGHRMETTTRSRSPAPTPTQRPST